MSHVASAFLSLFILGQCRNATNSLQTATLPRSRPPPPPGCRSCCDSTPYYSVSPCLLRGRAQSCLSPAVLSSELRRARPDLRLRLRLWLPAAALGLLLPHLAAPWSVAPVDALRQPSRPLIRPPQSPATSRPSLGCGIAKSRAASGAELTRSEVSPLASPLVPNVDLPSGVTLATNAADEATNLPAWHFVLRTGLLIDILQNRKQKPPTLYKTSPIPPASLTLCDGQTRHFTLS